MINKSRYYFLILICVLTSVQLRGQDDTSSIEQHCVNFFANYILGKEPKLQGKKVFFNWVSEAEQTFFSYPLNYIFSSNPELEKDIYYSQYAEPLRSEEHTSELQSRPHLVCRLLLEKKK